MKKRFLAPLMALLALFVLVGCSSKSENKDAKPKKPEVNISMKELEDDFHDVEERYYGIMEKMASLDQLEEEEAGKQGFALIREMKDTQKKNEKLIKKLKSNKAKSKKNKSATKLIISFINSTDKSLDTVQDAFKDAMKGEEDTEEFQEQFSRTVVNVYMDSSIITEKFKWEDSPKAQKFLDDIRNSEEDDSQEDGASSTEE